MTYAQTGIEQKKSLAGATAQTVTYAQTTVQLS